MHTPLAHLEKTGSVSRRQVLPAGLAIQRYAAEQQYYAYTSSVMVTSAWQLSVKNFAPNLTFDYGGRVAALWLER